MLMFLNLLFILLDLSSIETNEVDEGISNNEIFDFLHLNVIYENTISSQKYGCPAGSRVYNEETKKCIYCEYGKTNANIKDSKCNQCLPNFKKIASADNTDEFECIECPVGQISIEANDQKIQICIDRNCSNIEYFDLSQNKCIKCSDTITNAIERLYGTLPFSENCRCPGKDIKIGMQSSDLSEIKQQCVSNEEYKLEIFNNVKLSQYNDGFFNIHFYIEIANFFNCKPYQRIRIHSVFVCICNEEYIYRNGECQPCTDFYKNNDSYIDECKCPRGFEISENKCRKCPKGYYKDNESYEKCKKCKIFYITKNEGSKNEELCSEFDYLIIILVASIPLLIILFVIAIITVTCTKKRKKSATSHKNVENNYNPKTDNLYNYRYYFLYNEV